MGSQNPESNKAWGISKVLLENEELVLPGDEKTFAFNVTAPYTPVGIADHQETTRLL